MPESNPDQAATSICVIGEADPFLARLLQRFAEKSGLVIQRAQTGEDVLDLAVQGHPALIILDPELPGKLRGWEAAQTLQKDGITSAIPIILCAWLPPAEARSLVGRDFPCMQKPELHFEDFAAALLAAGLSL